MTRTGFRSAEGPEQVAVERRQVRVERVGVQVGQTKDAHGRRSFFWVRSSR